MRIVAELTDCDGAGLALRGCSGVEADDGVCLVAGIDLQLGLPGCEEGGQRVGRAVVCKLQVVAACALGRVQEQWRGGCTTPGYVKLSKQPAQTSFAVLAGGNPPHISGNFLFSWQSGADDNNAQC